jgi:hypothetical protein
MGHRSLHALEGVKRRMNADIQTTIETQLKLVWVAGADSIEGVARLRSKEIHVRVLQQVVGIILPFSVGMEGQKVDKDGLLFLGTEEEWKSNYNRVPRIDLSSYLIKHGRDVRDLYLLPVREMCLLSERERLIQVALPLLHSELPSLHSRKGLERILNKKDRASIRSAAAHLAYVPPAFREKVEHAGKYYVATLQYTLFPNGKEKSNHYH